MKSKQRFKRLIILILKIEAKLEQYARRAAIDDRSRQQQIAQHEVYHILYGDFQGTEINSLPQVKRVQENSDKLSNLALMSLATIPMQNIR